MADVGKKIAAKELGVSERTIDRLRDQGELTWHCDGAKVVIPEASIEAYPQRQADKAAAAQRFAKAQDVHLDAGGSGRAGLVAALLVAAPA